MISPSSTIGIIHIGYPISTTSRTRMNQGAVSSCYQVKRVCNERSSAPAMPTATKKRFKVGSVRDAQFYAMCQAPSLGITLRASRINFQQNCQQPHFDGCQALFPISPEPACDHRISGQSFEKAWPTTIRLAVESRFPSIFPCCSFSSEVTT